MNQKNIKCNTCFSLSNKSDKCYLMPSGYKEKAPREYKDYFFFYQEDTTTASTSFTKIKHQKDTSFESGESVTCYLLYNKDNYL